MKSYEGKLIRLNSFGTFTLQVVFNFFFPCVSYFVGPEKALRLKVDTWNVHFV